MIMIDVDNDDDDDMTILMFYITRDFKNTIVYVMYIQYVKNSTSY